jgi:hypothetical protein
MSQYQGLEKKDAYVLIGVEVNYVQVAAQKKSLSSVDDRLYIRFSAASYSPTKLPWQYHRR